MSLKHEGDTLQINLRQTRLQPSLDITSSLLRTACQVATSPAEGEVGMLILGAKLSRAEFLLGWLAVILMTLAAILSVLGNLILSYFSQQV